MTLESTKYKSSEKPHFRERLRAHLTLMRKHAPRFIKTPIISVPCITGFCSFGCIGFLAVMISTVIFLLNPPVRQQFISLPSGFPQEIAVAYLEQAAHISVYDGKISLFQMISDTFGPGSSRDRLYRTSVGALEPAKGFKTVIIDWIDLPQDRHAVLGHYGRLFDQLGWKLETIHDDARSRDEGFAAQNRLHIHVFLDDPVDNRVIDFMRVVVQYPNTSL